MEVRKEDFPRMKFSKHLYNTNHPKAVEAILPWLERNGYHGIDDKENYNADIRCMKDNELSQFELEVKNGWKGSHYPFPDVRIPYRKKRLIDKWIKEGSKGTLTFIVFNFDCSWGWFAEADVVKNSEIVRINNKYKSNEPFFKINLEDAKKVEIDSETYDKEALTNVKYPS